MIVSFEGDELINFIKRNRLKNDGVFLNRDDGCIVVLYSKYSFFKKGDVISFTVLCEALSYYKRALITNEILEEGM